MFLYFSPDELHKWIPLLKTCYAYLSPVAGDVSWMRRTFVIDGFYIRELSVHVAACNRRDEDLFHIHTVLIVRPHIVPWGRGGVVHVVIDATTFKLIKDGNHSRDSLFQEEPFIFVKNTETYIRWCGILRYTNDGSNSTLCLLNSVTDMLIMFIWNQCLTLICMKFRSMDSGR